MNTKLIEILRSGWSIPENLSVSDWGAKYLTLPASPYGTKYCPEMSPWMSPALEALKDNKVREIVLSCSAQSSKSTYLYLALAWALSEDPSPCLFYAPTESLSKRWARQRIIPILDACTKLKHLMPQEGSNKLLTEIQFPRGSLMIVPANTQNCQAHTSKWIICDEVSRFRNDGILSQIRARGTMYFDGKIILASTQESEDTDFNRAWLRTTQNVFHLRCPICSSLMPPQFESMVKWEVNEKTKNADGEYNFEELAKTVYLYCENCKSQLQNDDANWHSMVGEGEYVSMNPDANPAYQGYRWTALTLPPQILPISALVEEFLIAKREAHSGYFGNLKEFVNLRTAVAWNANRATALPPLKLEPYDVSETWEEAAFVFGACDVGGSTLNELWVCVRAFAVNGDSRLLHYSKVSTFEEVEEIRQEFGIKEHCMGIDSGYASYEVYKACAKYGWTAFKGEETTREDGYIHQVRGRKVRRPYSTAQRVDPRDGTGRRVTLFRHANNLTKDLLHAAIHNRTESKFMVGDVGHWTPYYLEQIHNEQKVPCLQKRTGKTILRWKKTGANHALDCEILNCVFAIMANIPISNRKQEEKD